jgi:hypothetical protein
MCKHCNGKGFSLVWWGSIFDPLVQGFLQTIWAFYTDNLNYFEVFKLWLNENSMGDEVINDDFSFQIVMVDDSS